MAEFLVLVSLYESVLSTRFPGHLSSTPPFDTHICWVFYAPVTCTRVTRTRVIPRMNLTVPARNLDSLGALLENQQCGTPEYTSMSHQDVTFVGFM